MPLDLSDVVESPDLGETILIYRSFGQFVAGGWQSNITYLPAYGVITPASDRDVQMIPEGDRIGGSMLFITTTPMFTSHAAHGTGEQPGVSDQVEWDGRMYRVASVGPWQDSGFVAAVLLRMAGD